MIATVLWVLAWVCCSAATQILNKILYSPPYSFRYPFALTFVHMVVSFACCVATLRVFRLHPFVALTWGEYLRGALPLAVVFIVNIIFGNIALLHIHVSFYQVLKASTPFFAVLLQFAFLSKRHSVPVVLSLVPVVAGVALATNYEVNFDMHGLMFALLASVTTAAQTILTSRLLSSSLDAINLLYYMAPAGALFLLPLIFFFSDDDGAAAAAASSAASDTSLLRLLVLSGIVAFLLNFSLFHAIKGCGVLTFVVLGNVKVVVVIVVSAAIIGNTITALNALGCIIAIAGAALCQALQVREREREKDREKEKEKRRL